MNVINTALRRLDNMFPGYFNTTTKRNHYIDFGYPEQVTFAQLWQMYQRNGYANAAIEATIDRVWSDNPWFQIGEEAKRENPAEKQLADHLRKIRFWQHASEADRRSMVGRYGALIFRFADNKRMHEPVDTVPGGIAGLVEVIPAWEQQLTVSTWETDELSEAYGRPTMFSFNEAAFDSAREKTRSFEVHPDRVLIWSRDGTVHGESMLLPGFNDLITLEKVIGAGGEGFWKNAKSAPVLTIDQEARLEQMAQAMNVKPDELADKMDEQVKDYQQGFDAMLLLQGIKAETLGVTLPQPEEFILGPLRSFAASFQIPEKILSGSQTGERASTEDASQWSKRCNSRRVRQIIPTLESAIERFQRYRLVNEANWMVEWSDLTEDSADKRIERSDRMAGINEKHVRSGGIDPVFTENELREAAGYEPLDEEPPTDDIEGDDE
jgi:hypothetical protein